MSPLVYRCLTQSRYREHAQVALPRYLVGSLSATLTSCIRFKIDPSNMAVTTQFLQHDRVVGVRDIVPQQQIDSEVTEAALHVFANFVEEIARIAPTALLMKEKRQISTAHLRRSKRFIKPLDGVVPVPLPAAQTIVEKVSLFQVVDLCICKSGASRV